MSYYEYREKYKKYEKKINNLDQSGGARNINPRTIRNLARTIEKKSPDLYLKAKDIISKNIQKGIEKGIGKTIENNVTSIVEQGINILIDEAIPTIEATGNTYTPKTFGISPPPKISEQIYKPIDIKDVFDSKKTSTSDIEIEKLKKELEREKLRSAVLLQSYIDCAFPRDSTPGTDIDNDID
jgi:hypothetical protein